jgi:hypothetical protein
VNTLVLLLGGCCSLSNEPGACSVQASLPATVDEVPDYGPDGEPYGDWIAVALADGPLSCGLRATGLVQCWGEGELPPQGTFDRIEGGDDLVCAQRAEPESGVVCWGSNEQDSEAINAEAPAVRWTDLAVGSDTVCGSNLDLTQCWGGEEHTLTEGWFVAISRSDAPCVSWLDSVCIESTDPQPPAWMLDIDRNHLLWCGIEVGEGTIWCWESSAWPDTPPLGEDWTEVDVGGDYACAVSPLRDGVSCWGEPSMVSGAPRVHAPVQVAAARDRACVLDGEGELYCWSKAPGAELVDCTEATYSDSLGEQYNCDEAVLCELDFVGREACCACNPDYCDVDWMLCLN